MTDPKQLARTSRTEKGLTLQLVCEMTGYKPTEVALISRTVAVGAPLEELAVFLHACRTLQLDPLLRQAYWIPRGKPPKGTLQVGIDGFRSLADRTGVYAGSEPAQFRGHVQIGDDRFAPEMARVTVWKIVAGHKAAFTGEAHWTEFYPGEGPDGRMWRKMPHNQLAKCAEAQALRKAFPAQLGALAVPDIEPGEELPTVAEPRIEIQPQPSRPRASAAEAAAYARAYPPDEVPDVPPEPEEEADTTAEEISEEAERSQLWQQNRQLSDEAAELRIRIPTQPTSATVQQLRIANAELERQILAARERLAE